MDKIYTNQLSGYLNNEVISTFLVSQKELREGAKDYYIRLRLSDKDGSINANIWNNAKSISERFKEGDVVKVKGVVISYKGQIQLTINKIMALQENDFDLADYIQSSTKNINELSDQLFKYIDEIKDEYLQKLLKNIFDDKEFYLKFAQAPAAKSWHHNYVGGLLEHSVSVAMICNHSASMYSLDKDLLITGAILHDIGKVYEYHMKSMIDFSTLGRLVGHICIGDDLVTRKAREINNFPENTLMKLRHLILSHHGEYEKAAARLPQTIEAIVLHYADNLDAQTTGVQQLINAAKNSDSEWTEFDKIHNRYFYMG